MTFTALAAVFAVGLLGGVHCIGMCGGIVAALSAQPVAGWGRALPVLRAASAVSVATIASVASMGAARPHVLQRSLSAPASSARARSPWHLQLAFNAGRIAAYALAGALAGTAGSMALFLNGVLPVQIVMYGFANLMLLGLGLYLLGITRHLAALERAGALLWRRIQPFTQHLLPANTVPRALALGAVWGWVPCGLVYGILATALVSGTAVNGAALMVAFGLGTLPNLLFAGVVMRALAQGAQGAQRRLWWRRAAGSVLLALGLLGLAHASGARQSALGAWLCFTPQ